MMNNMRSRNMMKTNYTTYFICFMIEVDAMSLKKIMSKPKKKLEVQWLFEHENQT